MSTLRAACVQFRARPDKADNLADMAPLVAEAAGRGADLVLLPEKWNAWLDGPGLRAQAERLDEGPTVEAMAGWARTHRVNLIGGSIAILGEGDRVENVSIAYDRDGNRVAAYTKIHLFDVDVGGISYRESDGTAPGSEPVVAELDGVRVGLTVCYDLRFPELYRTLALEGGATVLTVPSNFTLLTGMAHWEVLLRARADREPGVRARHRPARLPGRAAQAELRPQHDHRPVGDGARPVAGRRRRDRRRPRRGRPGRHPRAPPGAAPPPARRLRPPRGRTGQLSCSAVAGCSLDFFGSFTHPAAA